MTHSPASPSLFPGMERVVSAMPKSVSTQDIRQGNAGHYVSEGPVIDDPWPLLRARGLGLFHGEGMRINIEELNKLVLYVPFVWGSGANGRTYIRRCIQERQVDLIEEDIQDLLETGMRNTDTSLPSLSNERLIDRLVEVLLLLKHRLIVDVVVIFQYHSTIL